MIEEKDLDKNDILALKKPEKPMDMDEHEKKVIESCTLPKYSNKDIATTTIHYNKENIDTKVCKSITIDNIYNDDTDFVIVHKARNDFDVDTEIRISRDLLKKVIYDIYLT